MQSWKEHTTIAVRMVLVFALMILTLPALGQSRLSRPTLAARSSDRARDNRPAPATDWSKKMVDSTMKRYPTAKDLGSWAPQKKGYQGVLTKISLGPDGLTNITEICEGTNVADLAYYLARKRNVNDFHGLGAFLIMNEHMMKGAPKRES